MKRLLTFCFLVLITAINAQAQQDIAEVDSIHTYVTVIPEATFNLPEYLAKNIIAPDIHKDSLVVGKVVIKLTIGKDGAVEDAKVTKTSNSAKLDAEVLRVVKAMPKWNPAKLGDKPVRSFYTLPVYIHVQ